MSESQGQEVARLRLPLQVRGINRLVTYLEQAYGKGLVMLQDGDWVSFVKPAVPQDAAQTGVGAPAPPIR